MSSASPVSGFNVLSGKLFVCTNIASNYCANCEKFINIIFTIYPYYYTTLADVYYTLYKRTVQMKYDRCIVLCQQKRNANQCKRLAQMYYKTVKHWQLQDLKRTNIGVLSCTGLVKYDLYSSGDY